MINSIIEHPYLCLGVWVVYKFGYAAGKIVSREKVGEYPTQHDAMKETLNQAHCIKPASKVQTTFHQDEKGSYWKISVFLFTLMEFIFIPVKIKKRK